MKVSDREKRGLERGAMETNKKGGKRLRRQRAGKVGGWLEGWRTRKTAILPKGKQLHKKREERKSDVPAYDEGRGESCW